MAVIYSKLGGCLGDTTKLGPLARTDLCPCVKGLLDRLMTHFGLGSSGEDPGEAYWGVRCMIAFLGPVLSAWVAVLFPWEALRDLCLVECLVPWLTTWLVARLLPAWQELSPAWVWVVALLPAWEEALAPGKRGNCLSYCWVASFPRGKDSACLGVPESLTACLRCC